MDKLTVAVVLTLVILSGSATAGKGFAPSKIDELALTISLCGKPDTDLPKNLNAGAGSEGRSLIYRKYKTELWFYRGPESQTWAIFGAFPANGDSLISVAQANRRMPCLKNRIRAHMAGM